MNNKKVLLRCAIGLFIFNYTSLCTIRYALYTVHYALYTVHYP
ncbi:hypothetical protein SAMN05444369_11923 [Capnocytophaga haemolytica]|uniref:Uncharacterized protein n=1 Tax=Capnocytophaga haemolytica TaxID=45243 RepID=A0AAX2GYF2_9FLAO|nr:hypothetical protein SAMN05444369_11923 [Capnocytophaga haemolytica]SNV11720.1 Uncharacterised protein [Capnocytophaga haemolytica]